jgi:hypothetical protein
MSVSVAHMETRKMKYALRIMNKVGRLPTIIARDDILAARTNFI